MIPQMRCSHWASRLKSDRQLGDCVAPSIFRAPVKYTDQATAQQVRLSVQTETGLLNQVER